MSRRLALVDPTLWDFDSSESSGWRLGTSPASSVDLPHTCYNVTPQCTRLLPFSFWVTGSWRLANAAFPLCGTLSQAGWFTFSVHGPFPAGTHPLLIWLLCLPQAPSPPIYALVPTSHPAPLATGVSPAFSHLAQSLLEHEPSLLTGPW